MVPEAAWNVLTRTSCRGNMAVPCCWLSYSLRFPELLFAHWCGQSPASSGFPRNFLNSFPLLFRWFLGFYVIRRNVTVSGQVPGGLSIVASKAQKTQIHSSTRLRWFTRLSKPQYSAFLVFLNRNLQSHATSWWSLCNPLCTLVVFSVVIPTESFQQNVELLCC